MCMKSILNDVKQTFNKKTLCSPQSVNPRSKSSDISELLLLTEDFFEKTETIIECLKFQNP